MSNFQKNLQATTLKLTSQQDIGFNISPALEVDGGGKILKSLDVGEKILSNQLKVTSNLILGDNINTYNNIFHIKSSSLNYNEFVITNTGVGIGTDNPLELLDVVGNANIRGVLYTDNLNSISNTITLTGNILPNEDNLYDLGSETKRFRKIYVNDLYLTEKQSLYYDTDLLITKQDNLSLFQIDHIVTSKVNTSEIYIYEDGEYTTLNKWKGSTNIYKLEGNVGIGTSNPSKELDVIGNVSISEDIYSKSYKSYDDIQFIAANKTRLYINKTTGYVGLGTDKPIMALDVNGSMSINGTLISTDVNRATLGTPEYPFYSASISNFQLDKMHGLNSSISFIVNDSNILNLRRSNNTNYIEVNGSFNIINDLTPENNNISDFGSNISYWKRGYINTTISNKIGINTLDPEYDLDVIGDVNISNVLYTNNINNIISINENNVNVSGDLDIYGNLNMNGSLLPTKNSEYNLGESNKKWKNLYISNLFLENSLSIGTDESDYNFDVIGIANVSNMIHTPNIRSLDNNLLLGINNSENYIELNKTTGNILLNPLNKIYMEGDVNINGTLYSEINSNIGTDTKPWNVIYSNTNIVNTEVNVGLYTRLTSDKVSSKELNSSLLNTNNNYLDINVSGINNIHITSTNIDINNNITILGDIGNNTNKVKNIYTNNLISNNIETFNKELNINVSNINVINIDTNTNIINVSSTIHPTENISYNLGSEDKIWNKIYSNYSNINTLDINDELKVNNIPVALINNILWQLNGTDINYINGNVGIKTLNPKRDLEVNGEIEAIEFIGNGTNLTNLPIEHKANVTYVDNQLELKSNLSYVDNKFTLINQDIIYINENATYAINEINYRVNASGDQFTGDVIIDQNVSLKLQNINSINENGTYIRDKDLNLGLYLAHGGNIGIGTNETSNIKMEINDSTQTQLRITQSINNIYYDIKVNESNSLIFNPNVNNNESVIFNDSLNNKIMSIDSLNNRVSIGDKIPLSKLDIQENNGLDQLRLSYNNDSYVLFNVNESSDLLINPAESGKIIFKPTIDSLHFTQIIDVNGSTILNIDTINKRIKTEGRLNIENNNEQLLLSYNENSYGSLSIDENNNMTIKSNNDGTIIFKSEIDSSNLLEINSTLNNILVVNSLNENIGIGNYSPNSKLDIINITEQLRIGYDTDNYLSFITNSSGYTTLQPSNNGKIILKPLTDNNNFFKILSSTNVPLLTVNSYDTYIGFGTESPGKRVDIKDESDEGQLRLTSLTGIYTDFKTDKGGNYIINSQYGTLIKPIYDSLRAFEINTSSNVNILSVDTINEKIGIGNSQPSSKLDIINTTEQLRIGYDINNYLSLTTDNTGYTTFKTSNNGRVIFKPDTDNLIFMQIVKSNNTPILTIDSLNENTGLGTHIPGRKLDIKDGSGSAQLRLTYDTNKYTDIMTDENNNLNIELSSTGGVKINPTLNSGSIFQVNDENLDVILNIDSNNKGIGINTNTTNSVLQFSNTFENRKIGLYELNNNEHEYRGFGTESDSLRLQIESNESKFIFYSGLSSTSSKELMRITGDGKVGIGTNSPNELFEVAGNVCIGGNLIIKGNTTEIHTDSLLVHDTLILLSVNQPSGLYDSGIIIERGVLNNVGFIWDESLDEFSLLETTESGNTVGNINIINYKDLHLGDLLSEGNITSYTRVITNKLSMYDTNGLNITNDSDISLIFAKENGNIGINNLNPQYKLDINGSLNIVNFYLNGDEITVNSSSINYLDGITSNIQQQLDNISFAANSSGATSSITKDNLEPNRVLISNGSGKVYNSETITVTELDTLNGITSNIQNQIDSKLNLTGGYIDGSLYISDNTNDEVIINASTNINNLLTIKKTTEQLRLAYDESLYTSFQVQSSGNLDILTSNGATESIQIKNTTGSTSKTTGALVVTGGVGIEENLYTGGILKVSNILNSTSITTGSGVFSGGIGVSKTAFIETIRIPNTGNNDVIEEGGLRQYNDSDRLSGLISGTTHGLVLESTQGRHVGISVRGNNSNDCFFVAVDSEYINQEPDSLIFRINSNGNILIGNNSKLILTDSTSTFSAESGTTIDIKSGATLDINGAVDFTGASITLDIDNLSSSTTNTFLTTTKQIVSGKKIFEDSIIIGNETYTFGPKPQLQIVNNGTEERHPQLSFLNTYSQGEENNKIIGNISFWGHDGGVTESRNVANIIVRNDDHNWANTNHGSSRSVIEFYVQSSGSFNSLTPSENIFAIYGGDGNSKGKIEVNSTLTSIDSTNGALIVRGGTALQENLNIGGVLKVEDTTDSTSLNSGSGIFSGGIGVSKTATVDVLRIPTIGNNYDLSHGGLRQFGTGDPLVDIITGTTAGGLVLEGGKHQNVGISVRGNSDTDCFFVAVDTHQQVQKPDSVIFRINSNGDMLLGNNSKLILTDSTSTLSTESGTILDIKSGSTLDINGAIDFTGASITLDIDNLSSSTTNEFLTTTKQIISGKKIFEDSIIIGNETHTFEPKPQLQITNDGYNERPPQLNLLNIHNLEGSNNKIIGNISFWGHEATSYRNVANIVVRKDDSNWTNANVHASKSVMEFYIQSSGSLHDSLSESENLLALYGGTNENNGKVEVNSTATSTNSSNGALVIKGGVGIGDNLHMDGILKISNTTDSVSNTTGSLIVDGGAKIEKRLNVNGIITGNDKLSITDITDATTKTSAAAIISGGLGVSKQIYSQGLKVSGFTNINLSEYGGLLNYTGETSINTLVNGSAFGLLLEGYKNGHTGVNLRSNDPNDSFFIVSNSVIDSEPDTKCLRIYRSGDIEIGHNEQIVFNNSTSTLHIKPGSILDIGGNVDFTGASITLDIDNLSSSTTNQFLTTGIQTITGAKTLTSDTSVKLDSTNAFIVETSGGTDVFRVDTTNSVAGINQVYPTRAFTVKDTINPQLRLDYDGSNYTDFKTTSSGNLEIATSFPSTNHIKIMNTTGSTSKDTGALIVEGGAGIEENVYIGGDLTVLGNIIGVTDSANKADNFTVNNTLTVNGSTYLGTDDSVDELIVNTTISTFKNNMIIGNKTQGYSSFPPRDITPKLLISNGDTINEPRIDIIRLDNMDGKHSQIIGNITFWGNEDNTYRLASGIRVRKDGTNWTATPSYSARTKMDFYVQNSNLTYDAFSESNGLLSLRGGAGNFENKGIVTIHSTLESTSKNTGALKVNGGVGIEGNTTIGGYLHIEGIQEEQLTLSYDGTNYSTLNVTSNGHLELKSYGSVGGISLLSNVDSTSFLEIKGAGSTFVNVDSTNQRVGLGTGTDGLTYGLTIRETGTTQLRLEHTSSTYYTHLITNALGDFEMRCTSNRGLFFKNKSRFDLNESSTTTSSGTLIVTGGVGISENLNMGGVLKIEDTTDSTTTSTGSLILSGGLGVAKTATVDVLRIPTTGNNYDLSHGGLRQFGTGDPLVDIVTGATAGGLVLEGGKYQNVGISVRGNGDTDCFFVAVDTHQQVQKPDSVIFRINSNGDMLLGNNSKLILTDSTSTLSTESGTILDIKSGATLDINGNVDFTGASITLDIDNLSSSTTNTFLTTSKQIISGKKIFEDSIIIGNETHTFGPKPQLQITNDGYNERPPQLNLLNIHNLEGSNNKIIGNISFWGHEATSYRNAANIVVRKDDSNWTNANVHASKSVMEFYIQSGNAFNSLDDPENIFALYGGDGVNQGGYVEVNSTLTSTDSTTGGLLVRGGVGIAENINIGGVLKIEDITNAVNTTSGSAIFEGGIGVNKTAFINDLRITDTGNNLNTIHGGIRQYGETDILSSLVVGPTITGLVMEGPHGRHVGVSVRGNGDTDSFFIATSSSGNVSNDKIVDSIPFRISSINDIFIGNQSKLILIDSTSTLSAESGTTIDIKSGATLDINGNVDFTGASITLDIDNLSSSTTNTFLTTGAQTILGAKTLTSDASVKLDSTNAFIVETSGGTDVFRVDTTNGVAGVNHVYPTRAFTVKDASGNSQLRLDYDGSNYADFKTTSAGNLEITTSSPSTKHIKIINTTDSTSKDTGALIIEGGVGIEKNLYVGGNLDIGGTISLDLDNISDSATREALDNTGLQTIDGQKKFTGSIILGNSTVGYNYYPPVSKTPHLQISNSDSTNPPNLQFIRLDNMNGSNSAILANMTFWGNEDNTYRLASGIRVQKDGTNWTATPSYSARTKMDFYVQNSNLTYDAFSESNGLLSLRGGAGNFENKGIVTIHSTLESTSKDTGALVVNGGVGIEGNTTIGGYLHIEGIQEEQLTLSYDGTNYSTLNVTSNGHLELKSYGSVGGISLLSNVDSTSFLEIKGAGSTFVNVDSTNKRVGLGTGTNALTYGLTIRETGNTQLRLEHTSSTYFSSLITGSAGDFELSCTTGRLLYFKNQSKFDLGTSSTSTTTGTLLVTGGVGISENLNMGGILKVNDITNSTSLTTGSAIFSGGIGVAKTAFIGTLRISNAGNNEVIEEGGLRQYNGSDPLSPLIGGTTAGIVLESTQGRHIGVSVRGNGNNDCFFVATDKNYTEKVPDSIIFRINSDGDILIGDGTKLQLVDSTSTFSAESGTTIDIKSGATLDINGAVDFTGASITLDIDNLSSSTTNEFLTTNAQTITGAKTLTSDTSVKLDSTNAFIVEKAAGTDVFIVDTTNSVVGINKVDTTASLTIKEDTNNHIKLEYDAVVYTNLKIGSGGDFIITPSIPAASSVIIQCTRGATSKDYGALIVEGGVGIEEKLFVGSDIDIGGSLTFSGSAADLDNIADSSTREALDNSSLQTIGGPKIFTSSMVIGNSTLTNFDRIPQLQITNDGSVDRHPQLNFLNTRSLDGTNSEIIANMSFWGQEGGISNVRNAANIIVRKSNDNWFNENPPASRTKIEFYVQSNDGANCLSDGEQVFIIDGGYAGFDSGYVAVTSELNATANTNGALRVSGGASIQKDFYVGLNNEFTIDTTNNTVGIGIAPISTRKLSVYEASANPQFRIAYDGSNYSDITVSSAGALTIGASGSTIKVTKDFEIDNTGGTMSIIRTAASRQCDFSIDSTGNLVINPLTKGLIIKNTTDISGLFEIQDSAGTVFMYADSNTNRIGIGSDQTTPDAVLEINSDAVNSPILSVVARGSGHDTYPLVKYSTTQTTTDLYNQWLAPEAGTTFTWSEGIDNSDGDRFKIAYNTAGTAKPGTGDLFELTTSGAAYKGDNTTTWSTTSDQRIKTNIVSVNKSHSLDIINNMTIRYFDYTENYLCYSHSTNRTYVGVIAQELEKVYPDAVITNNNSTFLRDCNTSEVIEEIVNLKSVNIGDIQYHSFAAIQYLSDTVNELETRINELETVNINQTQLIDSQANIISNHTITIANQTEIINSQADIIANQTEIINNILSRLTTLESYH